MVRPFRGRYRLDGCGWRDIAIGICNVTHTPLTDVLRLPLDEAVAWHEAAVRFQTARAGEG